MWGLAKQSKFNLTVTKHRFFVFKQFRKVEKALFCDKIGRGPSFMVCSIYNIIIECN